MSARGGALPAPDYRPDIDGLRALSVIAVILFHAAIPGFGGGFVGVDVFFVISGYLITQLLVLRAGQPAGRWFAEFYLRRARRILPALVLVMAVTAAASFWLFTPDELIRFGRSLTLSVAMLANYAAREMGGYFDASWRTTPLQHLWSIAVEEQFYLAYPLLLFVVLKFARSGARRGLLAAGMVASFALCVWASRYHPFVNYYAPVTRAWELLAGALLALRALPPWRSRALREAASVVGVLAIAAAVVTYGRSTPFPGWYALAPAVGACALIAAGSAGGSVVNRVLAWRPLVFIGLISYSLYLWHVPVLVFRTYYFIVEPGVGTVLLELLVIFVLALASWRWIEMPLRRRRWLHSNRGFVIAVVAALVALGGFGIYLWKSDGLPNRFSGEAKRLVLTARIPDPEGINCMARSGERIAAGDPCRFGTAARPGNVVVLWGDSHALTLLPAVRDIAARRGAEVRFGALSNCRPLLGALSGFSTASTEQRCLDFNLAMTQAVAHLDPQVVILAGYWRFPPAESVALPGLGGPDDLPVFARSLAETVRHVAAAGRTVCVVRDVPEFPYDVRHALTMAQRRGISLDFNSVTLADAVEQQRGLDLQFDALENRGIIHSVNLREVLCGTGLCRMSDDHGVPLFSDAHHLTIEGARFVEARVEQCFAAQPMLPRIR